MADINSDDDPDSAAMAEAMGFTGFGMQRANRKRKLTPPAQTGANNAPLGKRRPLNLPQPVSGAAGGGDDDHDGGDGNPEEIDLDDEEDVDAGTGGVEGDVVDERAAGSLGALTVSDAPPAIGPQHHHPLPPRPQQQQQQTRHANNPTRRPGGGRASGGSGQAPWWEREWDPRLVDRMVENPWERLERQRGLGARGTWPAARAMGSRGGREDAAPAGTGSGSGSGSGGGVVVEQAAVHATVA